VSETEAKAFGGAREAWAEFGDAFADIGRQFREDYEQVSEGASEGSEESQQSIQRAVKAIRAALDQTARAIGGSLRDPQVKQETAEAGSALLKAVGVTLSEVGEALRRDAEKERGTSTT
jgi:hypothetical protein